MRRFSVSPLAFDVARWPSLSWLLFASAALGCEQAGQVPTPEGGASVVVDPPKPTAQSALAARLLVDAKGRLAVEFRNPGRRPLVVLRPSRSRTLARVPGKSGLQTLPPAGYWFEARTPQGAVVSQGDYAPLWPSSRPESAGLGDAGPADEELAVPAEATATQPVDLPFELPPGRYSIQFEYRYPAKPSELPPGWFAGTLRAPAVELTIPDGPQKPG